MKILVVKPPQKWWPYPLHLKYRVFSSSRRIFQEEVITNSSVVHREFNKFIDLVKKLNVPLKIVNFPKELDNPEICESKNIRIKNDHNFIFIRDFFISDRKSRAIVTNYSTNMYKKCSKSVVKKVLNKNNYETILLPNRLKIEGGDVLFFPEMELYFGGNGLFSSAESHLEICKIFKIKKPLILDTKASHLDMALTPLVSADKKIIGVVIYKDYFKPKGYKDLKEWCKKRRVKLINAQINDSFGTYGEGNYALNSYSLPGKLIGTHKFTTPAVKEFLKEHGIKHYITPLTQYRFLGGQVRCITNEI